MKERGPVEKRIMNGLSREDVIAVVDRLIAQGGALAGYAAPKVMEIETEKDGSK